jgi:hypothetical protein
MTRLPQHDPLSLVDPCKLSTEMYAAETWGAAAVVLQRGQMLKREGQLILFTFEKRSLRRALSLFVTLPPFLFLSVFLLLLLRLSCFPLRFLNAVGSANALQPLLIFVYGILFSQGLAYGTPCKNFPYAL